MRVHLTPQNLNDYLSMPLEKRRLEIVDLSGPPGFYLELRATSPGSGTWWCRYRRKADNRMMYSKIGRTTEIGLIAARKRALQIRGQVAGGEDPRGQELAERNVMTYAQWVEGTYAAHIRARKKSWRRDEGLWRLHVREALGDKALTAITRHDVQKLQTAMVEKGLSNASANHAVRYVRASLAPAVMDGLLERNPASKIPMLHEPLRERFLSDAELERLLHVLHTHKNRAVCQVILVLMGTGLRVQECLGSTWSDVSLERRIWVVSGTRTKSKRTHSIPINDATFEVLDSLPTKGTDGPLFISPKTGKRFSTISKQFETILAAAKIDNFRIHDCRHFYASALVSAGKSLYETQRLLNHSTPAVTQRYAHLSAKALEGASAAASDRLKAGSTREVVPKDCGSSAVPL
jgi:integrase